MTLDMPCNVGLVETLGMILPIKALHGIAVLTSKSTPENWPNLLKVNNDSKVCSRLRLLLLDGHDLGPTGQGGACQDPVDDLAARPPAWDRPDDLQINP